MFDEVNKILDIHVRHVLEKLLLAVDKIKFNILGDDVNEVGRYL
jgi:hypothetical protein